MAVTIKRSGEFVVPAAPPQDAPDWPQQAYAALQAFVATSNAPFLAPDIWKAAEAQGVPVPVTRGSWGGVLQAGRKAGLMKLTGQWRKSPVKEHHGRMLPEWVKV